MARFSIVFLGPDGVTPLRSRVIPASSAQFAFQRGRTYDGRMELWDNGRFVCTFRWSGNENELLVVSKKRYSTFTPDLLTGPQLTEEDTHAW